MAEYADFTSGDPGDWLPLYRCFGDQNVTGYCSHTVDALLKTANAELDPAKRTALFQRADAILAAELPAVPLFQKLEVVVRKSNLLGIVLNPQVEGPFWDIQNWHWRR